MTKIDLIKAVAEETGLTFKTCNMVISTAVDKIEDALAAGDSFAITGHGKFFVREGKERIGRNPRNPQETISIPAKKYPKFKAGKKLKDKVNGVK